MIKAFIFDMDGVIIDSEPLYYKADRMVINDFGIDIPDEEMNKYVGISCKTVWSDIKEKYNVNAAIDEILARHALYKKGVFENEELQAINGVNELLADLKEKKISIGLASSSPREFIEQILKSLNIIDYFEVIVSGEELKNGKPAPDIFLKAAELLNTEPDDCVVLEDSSNGVKAAKSAGMKCIAYKNLNSGIQDLSLADIIVNTLEKLNYCNI